jgi:hypothetical protein
MLPYIILMLAPLCFYQIAITKDDHSNREGWFISIGKKPHILNNSLIVPVFFLLYFVLLSLRDTTIGRDLPVYEHYFKSYSAMPFKSIWSADMDILYVLLNWLVGKVTDSFQIFLTVVAAITVLPVAKLYSEDKQYGFLKVVLFMNMSVFIMAFSGLRQSLALAFGVIAYMYARDKKPLRFLIFALITFGFHHTGFMVLLYYPLCHIRLQKNHLWFAIPTIVTVFIFNKQIFSWLANVAFSILGAKYEAEVEETGAYMMIILFVLFAVASYFFPDEDSMDDETRGLRNIMLMALVLQCFAPVHNLAMRMNYYFIIFVPIIVPKILKHSKPHIKDVAHVAKLVMVGFFVVYYLYTTYRYCQTGISPLNTYPYVPFWEHGGF